MFLLLFSFNYNLLIVFVLLLVLFCRCILFIDMVRYNEILNKFKDILVDGFSFENEVYKFMVRYNIVLFLMWGKISIIFKRVVGFI